ncbi:capsid protein [Blackfly genomovirus 8]|uniref:Capsid protein n=1 Tax=Blackfly genomovirus 8 TaxID=2586207 RepID=A0A4Y5QKY0_9VIRU|nr:capsid protein [Blackfly genomovirus 8]QCX35072.1 capsid protein [Blackfly genomovirus 8]
MYRRLNGKRKYRRWKSHIRKIRGSKRSLIRKSRRSYRSRGTVSRKRILNVSSVKHRDAMIPADLTSVGYRSIADDDIILWCPTARSLDQHDNPLTATYADPNATRNSQIVYMRGLREDVEISTSDSTPWFWRRVCFTMKGQFSPAAIPASHYVNTTLPGASRSQISYNRSTEPLSPAERAVLRNFLFEGMNQVDYFRSVNAPIDKYRVTVMYDKTVIINSGSGNGVFRKKKLWHGMNHTLVYNDQEFAGDLVENNFFAVPGNVKSMGDYYVADFFESASGFTGTLNFLPQATLYWHERGS